MVLTWTFNQPIESARFSSCFSNTVDVPVSGSQAIYTVKTNHPGNTEDSQPLYYELCVNGEFLFTGYFIIKSCT
jgi:hypothetical protein